MAKSKQKQDPSADEDMAADLLLKEADESLRQDELNAFWDEWGSTIIGVALMVILGTIIGVSWQKWQTSVRVAETTKLIQSKSTPDMDIALSGSYRGIANMIAAAEMAFEGEADSTEMTRLLEEAADSDMPREWDYLAQWGALRTRADAAEGVDAADIKVGIANDMVTLANKRNNPYTPAILMEAAILKGENNLQPEAVTLLDEALAHEATSIIPALQELITTYRQLYKTESAQ